MDLEERLSALLDGECPSEDMPGLLDAVARDPALKARWDRHCRTRDALAGVRFSGTRDLTDAVMAAIAADVQPGFTARDAVVVPLRPRVATAPAPTAAPARADERGRGQWRARLAGLAVAASITAVVAIGGRSLIEPSAPAASATVATVATGATPQTADIVRVGADAAVIGSVPQLAAGSAHWADIDAETASTLNDLLLEHANVRSAAGMGSALGSARIAVRTVDFRSAGDAR